MHCRGMHRDNLRGKAFAADPFLRRKNLLGSGGSDASPRSSAPSPAHIRRRSGSAGRQALERMSEHQAVWSNTWYGLI